MAILQIEVPAERIEAFCRKWKVREFALFGSVLREDFGPDSDVDVLVTFDTDAHWSLFDLAEMRDELRTIFGREVDLATRRGVEASRNPQRRAAILSSAQVIYAA
ncbi:MAG: nucleotidyltransferase family protein [Planctomycetales bacterium]